MGQYVWIIKVDQHNDSPYIAGAYDSEEKARSCFASILYTWWTENREGTDGNGRTFGECVEAMVYNDNQDYLEVERLEVQ